MCTLKFQEIATFIGNISCCRYHKLIIQSYNNTLIPIVVDITPRYIGSIHFCVFLHHFNTKAKYIVTHPMYCKKGDRHSI